MDDEKITDFFENTKSLLETHKTEIERKVDNFFSSLQFRLDIFQTAKKEMDVYLAFDFNVFDYIAPDENLLSDIIAGLLDPMGKHGQGDVFLREFLKVTGKSENYNAQKGVVIREDPTAYIRKSQRRIDITIDFGNSGIGIENKPWAGEQEEQIKDYQTHLAKKYNNNFLLLYLSGSGSEPESIDENERKTLIKQGKLSVLPYPVQFKSWLESCYKECKAEKVRWFLTDFVGYVERNFRIQYME